jgi:hypothetical protein
MYSAGGSGGGSSGSGGGSSSGITPVPVIPRAVAPDGSVASWRAGEEKSMAGINITQNFTATSVDAYDVHEKTIAAIKLGSTVTVPTPLNTTKRAQLERLIL